METLYTILLIVGAIWYVAMFCCMLVINNDMVWYKQLFFALLWPVPVFVFTLMLCVGTLSKHELPTEKYH